jgi:pyruvate formate lyase activating enzyme
MVIDSNSHDVSGWIFNIQRFSVHDGPGIRTTVFLKGCPLRCLWCDNPESQQLEAQMVFWSERCIHCDACLSICPESALEVDAKGNRRWLLEQCTLCGRCTEVCYAGALEQIGRRATVGEVLAEVEADRRFYEQSGGGVTLSGGEPLGQPSFSRGLLQAIHERGIHTAIETSGYGAWSVWLELLPHLDLILYDLKELDPERHQMMTGVSNRLILDNLRQLADTGKKVIVRRPVIPGYNDSPESIHALARFVSSLQTIEEIDLLPYHRFGRAKYDRLGKEYVMGVQPSLDESDVTHLQDIVRSYGLRAKIGG